MYFIEEEMFPAALSPIVDETTSETDDEESENETVHTTNNHKYFQAKNHILSRVKKRNVMNKGEGSVKAEYAWLTQLIRQRLERD